MSGLKSRMLSKMLAIFMMMSMTSQAFAAGASSETASGKSSERSSGEKSPNRKPSAAEIADIINSLDYPELQVVPRASERLRMEAKEEEGSWFFAHAPMQVAGLATLLTGVMGKSQLREGLSDSQKTNAGTISNLTIAVGGGWFVAGFVLGMKKPYGTGLANIVKLNGKDERTLLLRERLAEEALERPAKLMEPLVTASVISNLAMNLLMATSMTDQGRVLAGLSATLSFLPFIFEDRTISVYNKHLEYKKKIYGPLSSTGVGYDSVNKVIYPTATLTWMF